MRMTRCGGVGDAQPRAGRVDSGIGFSHAFGPSFEDVWLGEEARFSLPVLSWRSAHLDRRAVGPLGPLLQLPMILKHIDRHFPVRLQRMLLAFAHVA